MKIISWLLALATLIPYVTLGLAPYFGIHLPFFENMLGQGIAIIVLSAYSGVLLSFVGGVHWGCAFNVYLRRPILGVFMIFTGLALSLYGWSLLQFGWAAHFIPNNMTAPLYFYAAGFALAFLLEAIFCAAEAVPSWYLLLRLVMTAAIIGGLVLHAEQAGMPLLTTPEIP